ncbi:MAG: hypothetical protein JEY99_15245 [Spirochaetales bacterium]|nr:hypothetical protein [Spirochaetales bacterium]
MSFKTIEELELSEIMGIKGAADLELSSLQDFFRRLEKDSDPEDTSIVDSSYSSSFLFGDPDSANAVKKEDFLKFLPQIAGIYQKMGFQKKELDSLKAIKLGADYILLHVRWKMFFRNGGNDRILDNIRASYILKQDTGNNYQIILQLDHQKLGELI